MFALILFGLVFYTMLRGTFPRYVALLESGHAGTGSGADKQVTLPSGEEGSGTTPSGGTPGHESPSGSNIPDVEWWP